MAASPNDLTRQQLDELDALLQRMLSPTQTETAQNGWRADPPASVGTPHLAEEPALAVAEMPASRVNDAGSPAMIAPMPAQRFSPNRIAEQPTALKVSPLEASPIELAILTPAELPSDTNPKLSQGKGSLVLWPIAAINWLLESVLKLFGPPGEILTSRAGKNLLGMLGILLIIGAICWTAHSRGWIALPLSGLFGR